MTMSPVRSRRGGSNKADHFRWAFCPARSLKERGEKKQMGAILETA